MPAGDGNVPDVRPDVWRRFVSVVDEAQHDKTRQTLRGARSESPSFPHMGRGKEAALQGVIEPEAAEGWGTGWVRGTAKRHGARSMTKGSRTFGGDHVCSA
jgi:hypothetical protein